MKKQKDPKYSVRKSIGYMFSMARRHGKGVIAMCFVLAATDVTLNLTQLYVAPKILEKVEQHAPLMQIFSTIAVFAGALFLLTALSHYLGDAYFTKRINIRTAIMYQIHHKAMVTSYPQCFDPDQKKLLGKAMAETDGNVESTEHIWISITRLLTNIGCFALYLLTLANVHWAMIAVSLSSCVLAAMVRVWAVGKYRNEKEQGKFWNQARYLEGCTRAVETAKDIRIFGLGNWIRQLYEDVLRLQAVFIRRREKYLVFSASFGVLMTLLQNGVAYAFLLKMTLEGNLSASEFLLYFTAISGFTTWVSGILENGSIIYQEAQGIGAVLAYLQSPEQFRFSGGRPLPDVQNCELRLENVSFRYPGAEENLFENFNLTIHPGEKLAVVGLNGAGKTTLVKLLCGFYDPTEGRVTLNGIDIREFNRQEYYGLLCAVYQEFSVLEMTVAENVAQRVEHIDEQKVWHCLKLAGLEAFVRSLPQGLNTHVGREVYLDGVLFSGGQTQRLMLARALYKGGPLLVLDEPTAALDPLAESDIYHKYSEMAAGKTSLFISHRLASTRFCDRIVFLADGKIAEEGTHESLLARQGGYAKLYEVQSQYYQEGADFRAER